MYQAVNSHDNLLDILTGGKLYSDGFIYTREKKYFAYNEFLKLGILFKPNSCNLWNCH